MMIIPAEVKHLIYKKLDVEDVLSLRLVSRAWAHVGREYLLGPTITLKPYRDDFHRLQAISQHPYFKERVKHLVIEKVALDDYFFRCHLHIVSPESQQPQAEFAKSVAAFTRLEGQLRLYASSQEVADYEDILRNLPKLIGVQFAKKNCPFPIGTSAARAWRGMSNEMEQRGDTGFKHMIESLVNSEVKMKHLTISNVSFIHMWRESETLLASLFVNLEYVKLHIDPPNPNLDNASTRNRSFKAMLKFLTTAKGLKEIWLGYTNCYPDRLTGMPDELVGNVWPRLEALTLKHVEWRMQLTTSIIRAHPTIKRFRYLGRHIFQTDQIMPAEYDFMKALREAKLEKCDITEQVRISEGGIRYTYVDEIGLYDDDWNPTNRKGTAYSTLLENMAIRGAPMPRNKADLVGQQAQWYLQQMNQG